MTCEVPYEECSRRERPCFAHKMRFWREQGMVGVARPGEMFRTGTIKEHAEDIVTRSKANGYDVEPVGSRWV